MKPLDDTICALATAPGTGGLAVVRVSGPRAIACAAALMGEPALASAPGHTLHHGWVRAAGAAGERLDEVVVALFRAPRSYTREDVAELSCHGGRVSADRVLRALVEAGVRPAAPGEFTLRAFLSGRLDLAQAEAVADVIHAETNSAHAVALAQLSGALSRRVGEIEDRVTDALGEVEARVDFAEDVGGIEVPGHVSRAIADAADALDAMLAGAAFARAVREGVRVPLVGRPNVGKSSLFNALLGEERAIVADQPGTTRDRVSEAIELGGVRVTLSDTAGLRESAEPVEAIGVARTREALEHAPLAIWVVDGSAPAGDEDAAVARTLAGRNVIVALNKRDLAARVTPAEVAALVGVDPGRVIEVSAARGEGIARLREAIRDALGGGAGGDLAMAAGNPRHADALGRARAALGRAAAPDARGAAGELVALELREALAAIGEVTGREVGEDLLDRIFSRFCVGK